MKRLKEEQDSKDYVRIETGANIHRKTERRLCNKWGLRGYKLLTVAEMPKYRIYHFKKIK